MRGRLGTTKYVKIRTYFTVIHNRTVAPACDDHGTTILAGVIVYVHLTLGIAWTSRSILTIDPSCINSGFAIVERARSADLPSD